MFGRYGSGGEPLPRVLHISIARYVQRLPVPGEPLEYLVSLHEEGTGITWQQNVTVGPETERALLEATQDLHLWSLNLALTPKKARERAERLGNLLHETFLGAPGEEFLEAITPTAVLLDVDETTLNLPWELMIRPSGVLSQQTPFGRLVTTRLIPRRGRDPLDEDANVQILAVGDPTADLGAASSEVNTLGEMEGNRGSYAIKLRVLSGREATKGRFLAEIAENDYDILHFAGHASFDPAKPAVSALRFSDGEISADEVMVLPWKKAPPYLVFGSACESGRAAGGQRLVSDQRQSNGLVAAFLASGVAGYAGYFWPVSDTGAGLFARAFYEYLFRRENVGLAFLEARKHVSRELSDVGDLTGLGAILYGDAASKHRRDLAMAA